VASRSLVGGRRTILATFGEIYNVQPRALAQRAKQIETMPKPGVNSSLFFAILFVLTTFVFPLPLLAQTIQNSSNETPPGLPGIPDDCKKTGTPPNSTPVLQDAVSPPSTDAYETLGALYRRAGKFGCAVAAFEAALARNPQTQQTRYKLALALLENHEPKRAADELRAILRQVPESFIAHNALGQALQDLGESEQAASEFKAALKINPHFALASYDLGQLLSSEKKYQAAIYYFKEGLGASPAPQLASELKVALAVAYAQVGDYAESIALFKDAVALQPTSAELHFDLATAYAHHQEYPRAAQEYKEVLRLDPSHNLAELSLAKALMNLSAIEDALNYLEDYVRRNPNDPEGPEILGEALKDSARLNEATEALERAIQMNPSSYKAHCNLGVVFSRTGRVDDAIHELKTAINLKPDGTEARYQLGLILNKKKEEVAAKQQFEVFEHLRQESDRETKAAVLNGQGNEFLKQGRPQEAVEAYQKALFLEPKDARLHYNLAFALAKLKDRTGEERELEKAIELDAKFAQAHNQLGSSFVLQARFAEAEREFRAALESNPQYAEALNNLGTLFGRQGKNTEAATLFRQAVATDPQYTQAFVNLGLTLAAEGSYSEAETQLQSALSIEPDNASALTALGMLEGKTGRDADSVQTFRKLTALYPASPDAHINLGIALGDVYDLQSALAEFSEAIRLAPDSALARYNKGRVLYALSQKDQARQELGAAVHLSPNYVNALFLLGVVEHTSSYATELFQRVVNLQPNNSVARLYLGRNLLQEGKTDEAIAEWKKAVEADPENLSAFANLARTLARSGSPEAARYTAQLEALQQRKQLTDRVQQLNNFALQAASDNNWQQALGQLREAIKLCQQCAQLPILRKNIGIIYARTGDVENAKKELELALKLVPEGPEAVAVRETLRRLILPSPTLPR
jgi:tetratricopeptide (TPR) repeat protein